MATKNNPGLFDCFTNALPDEPLFTLLARDPDAPNIVIEWARRREEAINRGDQPKSDMAMVLEARECANAMQIWRVEASGKWRK